MPAAAAINVNGARIEGIARLLAAQVPSTALAAELLLMHALRRDRTWLYTHAEDALEEAAVERYFSLVARRAAGEPVQYIIGKQEFWGLEFEVTPAVLIPRPETEHLIEVALERIGAARRDAGLRIADIGTGSGCLAVALAKEFAKAQILATDISPAALEVARRNAVRHGVAGRVRFAECDLLAGAQRRPGFDLIVSNPPYIGLDEAATLERQVRDHEPHVALFGGPAGVEIYTRLIEQAEAALASDGVLVLELGYGAAARVREMVEARRVWHHVVISNDLAGIPRVLAAAVGRE